MKKLSMLALAVLALALSACGGSSSPSPTDKTPEGVMASIVKMRELVTHNKTDVLCDEYLTTSTTAMFKAFHLDCGDVFEEEVARLDRHPSAAKMAQEYEKMHKTVKIRGNVATYKGADGTPSKMLYVGGHWRADLSDMMN